MHPTARLHCRQSGHGPPLILLHGWGFHAGVWDAVAQTLATKYRVYQVDLPGHGHSPLPARYSLDELGRLLLQHTPAGAVWLGWSLGGLLALEVARRAPERVRGLVLVAATPRFVRAPDWPHAVEDGVFEQFAARLQLDPDATLRNFLALQVRGGEAGRKSLAYLQHVLRQAPPPQPQALAGGLDLLRHSDLRATCRDLPLPLRYLLGRRDTLVPAALARDWDALGSGWCGAVLEGAGHAPFLSHPQEFLHLLNGFLNELV